MHNEFVVMNTIFKGTKFSQNRHLKNGKHIFFIVPVTLFVTLREMFKYNKKVSKRLVRLYKWRNEFENINVQ